MKRFLVLSLMVCSAMHAQEPAEMQDLCKPKACCKTWGEDSFVQVGGSYSYVWITPHGHSSFHGNLGGAQALYEYKPRNFLYAGLKFAWRQGKTHQGANSRFLLDFDVEERIGYTFADDCDYLWTTLFSGLGYRYLGQKLEQPGLANLHFNYNEFYIPVGCLLNYAITSCFALGLNAVWMPQVYPAVTIIPLNGANWIINRTLKNFLVELPMIFSFHCYGDFTVELKPFFQYWQDGKTSATSRSGFALDVPGNTYLFPGVELNLGTVF